MLDLTLFGPAEVRVAGELVHPPPPKELALLAYVVLRPSPVPRGTLREVLWPDSTLGGLRVALSRLRALPGSDAWLLTDRDLVGLRADCDVLRFEAAVAVGDADAALEAWPDDRGPLLAGMRVRSAAPFHAWLDDERARLALLRNDSRRVRMSELEHGGQLREALILAAALLADDPLDEAGHRAVMRIEHARGRPEAALAQFERLRVRLRDEVGTEPAAETMAELERIEGRNDAPGERAQLLLPGDAVPGRAPWMVGRSESLRTVESVLQEQGCVLVHGAGGMGKTVLAAEIAARCLQKGGRVAWVRSGRTPAGGLFDALATALDARQEVARASSPAAAVRRALEAEKVDLLVLDDASNAHALARIGEAVPERCALLVTSRHRHTGIERVRLDRLQRAEARELLEFHAERVVPAPEAEALCALLGDHPFAVRIAGARLAADVQGVGTLIARVREAPHALALPPDLAEQGRDCVAALLGMSFEELPDGAYEALMAIGALPVPAATPELLSEVTGRTVDATEDALSILHGRALTERLAEPASDVVRYRVHDLTHSLAGANTHVRRSAVRRACLRFLDRHSREHDLLDAELASVVGAIQETLEAGEHSQAVAAMIRLCGAAGYFNGRGHTAASLALLGRTAQVAEGVDPSSAQALHVKLGNARRELLGDLSGARDSYRQAAELAHALGDERREAIARGAMGCMEVVLGRPEGEAMTRAALDLAREVRDDLALAHTLQNLSYIAGVQGRLEEAALLSAEAVAAADRLGPDVDPQEADHKRFFARFNLAVARWRGGDLPGGRAALEDALEVARRQRNPTWEAYSLQELADLEEAAGDPAAALDRACTALAFYDRHRMRREAQALRTWLAERGVEG